MKKMILVAAAAAMAFSVQAEFKKNPDANTLWSETGGNVSFSKWRLPKDFAPGPDKTRLDVIVTKGDGSNMGAYVDVHEDYPWFVVKLAKAERLPKKYFSLSTYFLSGNPKGMSMGVSTVNPGMYVRKLNVDPKKRSQYMRVDFYGKQMTFDYIGMQKVPEVAPEFANKSLKKGEEMVLTVTLQKPADSIQVKFFKNYTMPRITLNGKKSMELTGSADKKVWTLKVPYESFSGFPADKKIGDWAVIFELEIFRGDNAEKVYTGNTFEILP